MSVGEYYYFFNEDGAKNEHGVSYSHGLPFVINLEKYYYTHQIKIFREVMFNNDWEDCLVYACGDEGQFFYFNPRNNTILRDRRYSDEEDDDSSDSDNNSEKNSKNKKEPITNPNKPIDRSDENLYHKKKFKKPIKIN
jgi:hypothetical protein